MRLLIRSFNDETFIPAGSADVFPPRTWLATASTWATLDPAIGCPGVTLSDDNPLGPEHDDGLAALLAQRLAPEFGVSPAGGVEQMALRGRTHLDLRLRPGRTTQVQAY